MVSPQPKNRNRKRSDSKAQVLTRRVRLLVNLNTGVVNIVVREDRAGGGKAMSVFVEDNSAFILDKLEMYELVKISR